MSFIEQKIVLREIYKSIKIVLETNKIKLKSHPGIRDYTKYIFIYSLVHVFYLIHSCVKINNDILLGK